MISLGRVSTATKGPRPSDVLVDGKILQEPCVSTPDPFLLYGNGPFKIVCDPF